MNGCTEEARASASEVKVEPNSKVEPEFKVKVKVEGEFMADAKVKGDQKFKDKPGMKVTPEIIVEPEVKVEPKVNADLLKFSEDREFDFLRPDTPGFRRSSSLKTVPTSPDTPHQKKAVRFADALGLDLESVRHILNSSEPPIVPSSAMRDLNLNSKSEADRNDLGSKVEVTLEVPCLRAWFSNPATSPDFERQVLEWKIRLATCFLDSVKMTVNGTIRVLNVAYAKSVTVRFTSNAWVTFTDVDASYVSGSGDGRTDYFQFVIELKDYFVIGSRMEFSVRLACDGETYWDSNNGCNYRIECCAALSR